MITGGSVASESASEHQYTAFGFTYFSKEQLENSPSKRDGFDTAKEKAARKQMVKLIEKMTTELKLKQFTFETACFYCHRFFAVRSMAKNDKLLVAAACVFLAGKSTESPRSLRDVAFVYQKLRYQNNPSQLAELIHNTDQKLAELQLPDHLLTAERAVLYTLNFQLQTIYAFNSIARAFKTVIPGPTSERHSENHNSDPHHQQQLTEEQKKVLLTANSLFADSWNLTVSLQYPIEKLAYAAVYQAFLIAGVELPVTQGVTFIQLAKMTQAELDDITSQYMSLYVKKPLAGAPAPPEDTQEQPPAAPANASGNEGHLDSERAPQAPASAPSTSYRSHGAGTGPGAPRHIVQEGVMQSTAPGSRNDGPGSKKLEDSANEADETNSPMAGQRIEEVNQPCKSSHSSQSIGRKRASEELMLGSDAKRGHTAVSA